MEQYFEPQSTEDCKAALDRLKAANIVVEAELRAMPTHTPPQRRVHEQLNRERANRVALIIQYKAWLRIHPLRTLPTPGGNERRIFLNQAIRLVEYLEDGSPLDSAEGWNRLNEASTALKDYRATWSEDKDEAQSSL